jgi:sterol 3beta-glucosyltransferase
MRVTVIAVGSRGDVQPLLALAIGLRDAGHTVRFATESRDADVVASRGLEYHPLSGDAQAFNTGPAGRIFRASMEKPATRYRRFWSRFMGPGIGLHLREILASCEGADVLLSQPSVGFGPSIAEKFGIASVMTGLFPVPELPTRAFPFPFHPTQSLTATEHDNWRSWRRAVPFARVPHPVLQKWRQEVLGLPAQNFRESLEQIRNAPRVLGYSAHVLPKPIEWGEQVEVTGYWYLPASEAYEPPEPLRAFLEAGEAPVVVGFGSIVGRDPRRLTGLVVEALRMAGCRGILVQGWGALQEVAPSRDIFCTSDVPYDWLLPRSAALIHHGGAGTTGIAFRAGVPQMITPFSFDSEFWGQRCASLGLGVPPVAAKVLTAESLAQAIRQMTDDSAMRARAEQVAEAVRAERGIDNAVMAIERFARARQNASYAGEAPALLAACAFKMEARSS